MHVYGRLGRARVKFIFGCRRVELAISLDGCYATRHVLRSVTRMVISVVDPSVASLSASANLPRRRAAAEGVSSAFADGSNWDPGERLTLLGPAGDS